ncbi:MAG: anthranilate synthase component I [Myxococcales bacterium]|nr:anthranilate synthase component I [Myxococcales bacterium]
MQVPSKEEFVELAAHGNLIPVYREVVADDLTPVAALHALGATTSCEPAPPFDRGHRFLLESVLGGAQWANYSFVGGMPRASLQVSGTSAVATWRDIESGGGVRISTSTVADPTDALAAMLREFQPVSVPGLPRFWGGAVGHISYDCVRAFERLPARAPTDLPVPDLRFIFSDIVLIFDHLRQTIKIVATPLVKNRAAAAAAYDLACERIERVWQLLRTVPRLPPVLPPSREVPAVAWTSSFAKPDYLAAVGRIKEYIRAGDAFQVVLSQRLAATPQGVNPLDVYRCLRLVNPSPYMYYLESPEFTIAGASPETLVRYEGREIAVRPIAGTRPRGGTAARDAELAAELLADPKERAEHLMLVDLGRNDVGRVCVPGSVEVTELAAIEQYSHVMHMVSSVRGTARPDVTWQDVLRATFPAGTLSGAPKIRAMEIIDELEPHRRGVFGGAVGYVSYDGNMDVAIAIRTLVSLQERMYVQAGAGIVADSDPAAEYQETIDKASAVFRALSLAEEGCRDAAADR